MAQIDWLSINYKGTVKISKLFTSVEANINTKFFHNITELKYGSEVFCTLAYNPKSAIIPADLIQVKFANRWLYQDSLHDMIDMLVSEQDWKFNGFSRIDLCYDFNMFEKHLHPEVFIQRYFNRRVIKFGKAKFHTIGQNGKQLEFQYLKFGSKSSIVNVYMYNKTRELDEAKNKPYIREKWDLNGIDQTKDVWRLEFSIKGDSWKLQNTEDKKQVKHEINILKDGAFLASWYATLLDRHFKFYPNKNAIKTRNKPIQLLPSIPTCYKLLKFTEIKDSTKSDKVFIGKLLSVYDELRQDKKENNIFLKIAQFEAKRKSLLSYYDKKIQELEIIEGKINKNENV